MLNKAPEDINFWDVIVAIEGTGSFFNCKEIHQQSSLSCSMNKGPEDFQTPCLIHSVMRDAEYQMQAFLEEKTLR